MSQPPRGAAIGAGTEGVALSIVVVSWNSREYTLPLLSQYAAAIARAAATCEIVVVDNASTDGTAAAVRGDFPGVRLIANSENTGYTAAANAGIVASGGRFVLLSNPDLTLPADFSIDGMLASADREPAIGVTGCTLLNPDGTVQSRGEAAPTLTRIALRQVGLGRAALPRAELPRRDTETTICRVDWVTGAWMLVRRQVFQDLGLLDPGYFMYGEDLEFCLRTRGSAWGVGVIDDVTVTHHHSKSTLKNLAPMLVHAARAHAANLALADGQPLRFSRRAALAVVLTGGALLQGLSRLLTGDPAGGEYLRGALRIPQALAGRSGSPGVAPRGA